MDRWIEEFALQDGWVRAFPLGTFRRGDRTLRLTTDKVREMVANFRNGRPQFDVPVNIEHQDQHGRIGTVKDMEARDDGLYVKLSDDARQYLAEKKFAYVSPEIVWDGWQDNKSGKTYANVVVGLAATNKPFFGKDVALFSARGDEFQMCMDDYPDGGMGYLVNLLQSLDDAGEMCGDSDPQLAAALDSAKQAVKQALTAKIGEFSFGEQFKDYTADERKAMAAKGWALPDGSFPIATVADLNDAIRAYGRAANRVAAKKHIMKRAKDLGRADLIPADWLSDGQTAEAMAAAVVDGVPSESVVSLIARLLGMHSANKRKASRAVAADAEETQTEEPSEEDDSEEDDKGAEDKHAAQEADGMGDNVERLTALEAEKTALADKLAAVEAANQQMAEQFRAVQEQMAETQRRERLVVLQRDVTDKFTALALPQDFTPWLLRCQEALGAEDFAVLTETLRAANEAVASGKVFGRLGGVGRPATEADTFNALIVKYQSAGMTFTDASARAASERPDLYAVVSGAGR